MEDILAQIKALASDADDVGRKRILQSLQELSYAIETPQDSMQRILYLVSTAALSLSLLTTYRYNVLETNRLNPPMLMLRVVLATCGDSRRSRPQAVRSSRREQGSGDGG